MNATTKSPTMTVSLGQSQYGTPRPQIELRFPGGTSHRHLKAAVFSLAARIELATPEKEGWVVTFEAGEDRAWVWLEVIDGFDREIQSGMKVLRGVVG
jgi:hypothetical protein